MKKRNEAKDLLQEMLELADIKRDYLSEDDEDKEDVADDFSDIEIPDSTDMASEKDQDKDKGDKGEIKDEWKVSINAGGEFKIEFYDNFVYCFYKNKRSKRIKIDPKLKPYKKLVSEFTNNILTFIEKKS